MGTGKLAAEQQQCGLIGFRYWCAKEDSRGGLNWFNHRGTVQQTRKFSCKPALATSLPRSCGVIRTDLPALLHREQREPEQQLLYITVWQVEQVLIHAKWACSLGRQPQVFTLALSELGSVGPNNQRRG